MAAPAVTLTVKHEPYGKLTSGEEITLWTLSNSEPDGIQVQAIDYGQRAENNTESTGGVLLASQILLLFHVSQAPSSCPFWHLMPLVWTRKSCWATIISKHGPRASHGSTVSSGGTQTGSRKENSHWMEKHSNWRQIIMETTSDEGTDVHFLMKLSCPALILLCVGSALPGFSCTPVPLVSTPV
jgi:hypothetical protein